MDLFPQPDGQCATLCALFSGMRFSSLKANTMDILIVSLTIVAGFGLFIGVLFLISKVMPPKIRDHFKALYTTVRTRVRFPGRPRNPYSFSKDEK